MNRSVGLSNETPIGPNSAQQENLGGELIPQLLAEANLLAPVNFCVARNPIYDLLAVGDFVLVCVVLCVFLSRFRRLSFLRAGVVFAALALEMWSGMVSGGNQKQRRGWWIPTKNLRKKCWHVPSR